MVGHPHDPFKPDRRPAQRPARARRPSATLSVAELTPRRPARDQLSRSVGTSLTTTSGWTCSRRPQTTTSCAYKGTASYVSADGAPDVAWFYPDPLHDALPVKDLLCFWRDATVEVHGERVPTGMPGEKGGHWSRSPVSFDSGIRRSARATVEPSDERID